MPVYNGLTDEWHPTQILADFLTLREHVDKPLADISFCYLGDARSNMADSYLVGGAKLGMDVRIASPRQLWPRDEFVDLAQPIAARTGATITITEDIEDAVQGLRRARHGRLAVDGRARGGLGRANPAAPALPGQRGRDGSPATPR